jgi:hypothetical protein
MAEAPQFGHREDMRISFEILSYSFECKQWTFFVGNNFEIVDYHNMLITAEDAILI